MTATCRLDWRRLPVERFPLWLEEPEDEVSAAFHGLFVMESVRRFVERDVVIPGAVPMVIVVAPDPHATLLMVFRLLPDGTLVP